MIRTINRLGGIHDPKGFSSTKGKKTLKQSSLKTLKRRVTGETGKKHEFKLENYCVLLSLQKKKKENKKKKNFCCAPKHLACCENNSLCLDSTTC